MAKALFALPFVALMLIAAKPAPVAAPAKPSLNAPAEVAADPANRLNLELSNGGTVVIQLRPDVAPHHVQRIQQLASSGFYNGTVFHRVIPGFMAQGGDPTGTGNGDSPLPNLASEFNDLPHLRGVMSMARAEDPNSANSQFFIMLVPTFKLDHDYTGFGRVVSGMQFVDQIAPGEPPASPTKIVRAWLDGPAPVAVAAISPAEAAPEQAAPAADMAQTAPPPAADASTAAPAETPAQTPAEVTTAPTAEPESTTPGA
jgi:peptidylprolyl isomerase